VTWTNRDDVPHNITSIEKKLVGDLDDGSLLMRTQRKTGTPIDVEYDRRRRSLNRCQHV
jgi:plastocyanin